LSKGRNEFPEEQNEHLAICLGVAGLTFILVKISTGFDMVRIKMKMKRK
jgi:hypothetical protein